MHTSSGLVRRVFVALVTCVLLASAGCARCSSPSQGSGAPGEPGIAPVGSSSAASSSGGVGGGASGSVTASPAPTGLFGRRTELPSRRKRGELETTELFNQGADETSPVVVAIHGMGDAPGNWAPTWRRLPVKAQVVLPRAPHHYAGGGWSWYKYEVGMPDDELARGVAEAERQLWATITEIAGSRRIVVTGFSQGGILSFAIAAKHPGRVALALPVGGLLPKALWPSVKPAPTVALHGDQDKVVPYTAGARAVEVFKTMGGSAELLTYRGVAHSMTSEMRVELWSRIRAAVDAP
ncbi:MAG: alpha/beta fold hydrolase [Polyangiaceae bacterium]